MRKNCKQKNKRLKTATYWSLLVYVMAISTSVQAVARSNAIKLCSFKIIINCLQSIIFLYNICLYFYSHNLAIYKKSTQTFKLALCVSQHLQLKSIFKVFNQLPADEVFLLILRNLFSVSETFALSIFAICNINSVYLFIFYCS